MAILTTRASVLEQVKIILRKEFDQAELDFQEATLIEDVPDWDSVAHVRIIVAVENRFRIILDPEEYTTVETVGEIVDCTYERLLQSIERDARDVH